MSVNAITLILQTPWTVARVRPHKNYRCLTSKTNPFSVSQRHMRWVDSSITIFSAIMPLVKMRIKIGRREHGRLVRALDLKFRGPEFKSHSDLLSDFLSVIVSSNPRPRLWDSQLARRISVEILVPVIWLCIVAPVFLVWCTILTLSMILKLILSRS